MSLHIICYNKACIGVVGYTRETNLVWSFVAQRVDNTCDSSINSFSPSELGVRCALASIRQVGSATQLVEESVVEYIHNEITELQVQPLPVPERFVDWTRDVPMNIDVTSVEELVNRLTSQMLNDNPTIIQ